MTREHMIFRIMEILVEAPDELEQAAIELLQRLEKDGVQFNLEEELNA